MHRYVAESLALDIEQNDLRKCERRLKGLRELAAVAGGPERELILQEAQKAEDDLKQWSDLASLVRLLAAEPEKISDHPL